VTDPTTLALTDRVLRIVELVYSAPPGTVDASSSKDTVEQWDSLGHLGLMLEIEQEFAVQLGPEDMERMTSVAAIVEVLVAR
jgi:acyl carrier protein